MSLVFGRCCLELYFNADATDCRRLRPLGSSVYQCSDPGADFFGSVFLTWGACTKMMDFLNSFHGFWQKLLRFHRFRGSTFSDMPKLSLEWPLDLLLWRFGWAVGRSQINGTVAETLNDCSLSGLPTEMI